MRLECERAEDCVYLSIPLTSLWSRMVGPRSAGKGFRYTVACINYCFPPKLCVCHGHAWIWNVFFYVSTYRGTLFVHHDTHLTILGRISNGSSWGFIYFSTNSRSMLGIDPLIYQIPLYVPVECNVREIRDIDHSPWRDLERSWTGEEGESMLPSSSLSEKLVDPCWGAPRLKNVG